MNAPKFRLWPMAVDRSDVYWYFLALVCLTTFVVGMALLGVSRISGYFYLAALVVGTPLLLRMDYSGFFLPRPVAYYLLFLAAFSVVCLGQLFLGEVEISILEYVARMWIGIINGFFFFTLFRYDRRALYGFVALTAGCHAAVSVGVTFFQGIDFTDFWYTGERAGGMTNPIPYSNMLLISVGLVAIRMIGFLPPTRLRREIALVAAVCLAGLVGVVLTGTRGTLVAIPWLLILLTYGYRGHFNWKAIGWSVAALAAVILVAAIAFPDAIEQFVTEMFDRTRSVNLRLKLWLMSWDLFLDAPLFGHGLDSIPQVLVELGLIGSEKSRFFGFNHMHNQLLDLLVKTGIVGTVAFFGSMVMAIMGALPLLRNADERRVALSIFWVCGGYFAFGLTSSYFSHANTILQFGVYLGMLIWLLPSAERTAVEQAGGGRQARS